MPTLYDRIVAKALVDWFTFESAIAYEIEKRFHTVDDLDRLTWALKNDRPDIWNELVADARRRLGSASTPLEAQLNTMAVEEPLKIILSNTASWSIEYLPESASSTADFSERVGYISDGVYYYNDHLYADHINRWVSLFPDDITTEGLAELLDANRAYFVYNYDSCERLGRPAKRSTTSSIISQIKDRREDDRQRGADDANDDPINFVFMVYVDGYFHISVKRDEVKRALSRKIDEIIPTTPRGIDFIMPTHAEMLAAGDDEIYKYSIGMWILDKRQWDGERNWQRREMARRERGGKIKKPEPASVVMRFPGGAYAARLDSPEELAEESERLGHCVGDPKQGYIEAVARGDAAIFSIRDEWGDSAYTLEAKLGKHPREGEILSFPQVKSFRNMVPTGTRGAGYSDARMAIDTPAMLENVVRFIAEYANVDPNTVADLSEARKEHPELFEPFKRKNPGYGRRHARDARHNPTYSFDEPWYPRE